MGDVRGYLVGFLVYVCGLRAHGSACLYQFRGFTLTDSDFLVVEEVKPGTCS